MKQGKIVAIVCMFIMLMVTQKLIAVYPLTRTYSISPDSLHQIRAAAGLVAGQPSDGLITQYWETYTRTYRDDIPDPGDLQRDRSYTDSFGFEGKAIDTYTAVVDYNNPLIDYSLVLDDVRNYLFTFPWDIYQNALKHQNYYPGDLPGVVPTVWDDNPYPGGTDGDQAWWQLTDYQRAREMSYNLILMSYIVDMLYYAHDRSDPTAIAYTQFESILTNLNAHMNWIHTTFFNYGLPNSPADGWNNTGWNIKDLYEAGDPNIIAPLGMCADNNGSGSGVYLPSLMNGVSRFHIICGMGYASILTGQDTFLNTFVKNEFKSVTPLPAETPFYGFNDYLTTNSGMFIGGLTYQNRFFYISNLFLTALKRTKGINLYNSSNDWNCDMIPRMVRYTLRRIDPELHHITFGDDWRYNGIESDGDPNTDMNHSIQIERGLLSFYYQNTDDPESHDNIRWYVSALKNSANNTSGDWPREIYEHDFASSFETVMNYQATLHGGPVSVTTGGSLPSYISQGTYSNSESTILRSPTSSYSGYSASHMLVVNHENSFVPYHNNDDNTAFQFYLWGKPVIVEPGYVPYILGEAKYWDWYQSPFSQNLLLINPASPVRAPRIDEAAYLSKSPNVVANFNLKYEDPMNFHSWPISWLSRIQETRPYYNKASKQFLLRNINSSVNDDIEHLRIHFKYNNSMTNSFEPTPADIGYDNEDNPCHVFRNFYKVSDKYFIVLDKAIFEETQTSNNVFRNQMNCLIDLRTSSGNVHNILRSAVQNPGQPGIYQYIMSANKNMFIAMGSSIDGVNSYSISNPDSTKLAWTPHDWSSQGGSRIGAMQRLSITASSPNNQERFITLLYPSVNSYSYNPVTEAIHDNSGYRLAITEGSRKVFVSLCSDSTLVYPDEDYRFGTDGDFFVVDAEPDFSSIHDMILSNGSALTASPHVGSSFPAQDLFRSFSDGLDEVIASWKDGSLHVTFKTNQALYPKYKIKRCEVLPSQFFSKTEYGMEVHTVIDTTSSTRGTIADNVNTLAYDNQYFYVNYTWNDLSAAGLIDDNLVIVKATIPELNLSTDINIQGVVSIIGSITINNGASMEIYPNSSVTISGDVDISNHGTLIIDGGTSISVRLNKANQLWSGITTHRDGNLTCNNAVIEGAQTGISIRGNSSITHSEITNCYTGIAIETGTTFTIEWNSIYNNTYGLVISNNQATISYGVVTNNEVTQNSTGVLLYNSNTKLAGNSILHNTRAGIHVIRESDPIIKDSNVSYTEYNGSSRPEITLESDSYPIIDDARNDINADGLGYSLYYVNAGTARIKQLVARNNYWGSTDAHQIRNSIYPLTWDVVYDPFCLEPNTYIPYLGDNLFKQALQAEETGELAIAKQIYTSIVLTEPDSLYALQSLGRLNSLYAESPNLLSELRNIYSVYALSCSDSILVASAQVRSIMLDRFDMQYLQAIQGYEDLLETSNTELDSLLCLLDIAYTLQDMYNNDQGKGMHTSVPYQANGIQVSSLKEANLTVDRIWSEIMRVSDNTTILNVPVPTQLDVTNYPNPFNPTTTIAFSLPEEGVVRLSVYNIRGQLVKELINGSIPRGFHKVVWDGRDNRNRSVSSGLYFVRVDVGNTSKVKKIMMLK